MWARIFEKFLRVYYSYFIRWTSNKLVLTFLDLAKFLRWPRFDARKTVILLYCLRIFITPWLNTPNIGKSINYLLGISIVIVFSPFFFFPPPDFRYRSSGSDVSWPSFTGISRYKFRKLLQQVASRKKISLQSTLFTFVEHSVRFCKCLITG